MQYTHCPTLSRRGGDSRESGPCEQYTQMWCSTASALYNSCQQTFVGNVVLLYANILSGPGKASKDLHAWAIIGLEENR